MPYLIYKGNWHLKISKSISPFLLLRQYKISEWTLFSLTSKMWKWKWDLSRGKSQCSGFSNSGPAMAMPIYPRLPLSKINRVNCSTGHWIEGKRIIKLYKWHLKDECYYKTIIPKVMICGDRLFYNTRKQNATLFDLSWEHVSDKIFCHSGHVCESTTALIFGVTNI